MTQGTVILTPFPFTDLAGNKVRPALVVSSSTRKGDDIIIAFISSVFDANQLQPTDIPLTTYDVDFSSSGLKKNSVIKLDKLATIDKKIVIGELGNLGKPRMKMVFEKLKFVFDIQ